MATRIESILTRARDTLADPTAERWSDARLLRLLDEGQKDLAKQTKILKGQFNIVVQIGVFEYTLPDNLWLITRATFTDYSIPLISYDQMDEDARKDRSYDQYSGSQSISYSSFMTDRVTSSTWQLDEGSSIAALIYDNRNLNSIRMYPVPNAGIADANYNFINANTVEFAGDEMLGIVTDITDYTFDTPYGLLTSLYDPTVFSESSDIYGVTTSIEEANKSVVIWYIRIPDEITTVTDTLETPLMFDVALKHYVIGNAFRDDLDVQYRDMGAESLRLYSRELEVAQNTNQTDGTRSATTFRSTYRGAFD
jgi:hypothetical protein